MLIVTILYKLSSTAVTLRRDKAILYSRITVISLLYTALLIYNDYFYSFLGKGISLFGGLLHVNPITVLFHFVIAGLSLLIVTLTSFYPRKIKSIVTSSLFNIVRYYFISKSIIINKKGEQFKIIEYSLLLLFVIIGALFLISSTDLITMFISLELQSYGLYIVSSAYRNSESATGGGLMYFLLGGLSSCFILLSTALLYSNSGTTSFDNLYIINSISNYSLVLDTTNLYWYNCFYITISFIVMAVGFLFKVSAAPFHF